MNFVSYILTFAFAATPLSLLIFLAYVKFFTKNDPTLAKTTAICTTVTGNLTKGVRVVKTIVFDHYEGVVDDKSDFVYIENTETTDDTKLEIHELKKEDSLELIATNSTLLHYEKTRELENLISGFIRRCGFKTHEIQEEHEVITSIHTNTDKKISTIITAKGSDIQAFNKGNPSKILERCTRIRIHGQNRELTASMRRKLKTRIDKLDKNGEKAIGFAYKPLPQKRLDNYTDQFTENDLVFLGMIGLGDYVREELIETVEAIKEKDIKIYIISDERGRKTLAAGRQLGITNPRYFEALSAKDLDDINDKKLQKLLHNKEKDYVFFNLKPAHKEKIIEALRQNKETVTLSNRDNKLKDVLNEINEQQQNIENRPRIYFHSISCKIAQLLLLATSLLTNTSLPLTFLLIILIDLAVNSPLELSLRKERNSNFKGELGDTLANGLIGGSVLAAIFIWNLLRFGWKLYEKLPLSEFALDKTISMSFVTLILLQVFSAHSIRKGFLGNPILTLSSILSLALAFLLTHLELLGLIKLSLHEWTILLFTILVIFVFQQLFRYITRNHAA